MFRSVFWVFNIAGLINNADVWLICALLKKKAHAHILMSMLTKHFKLVHFIILIIEVPYEIQSSREMLPLITTAVSIIVIVGYAQKQSIKIACLTVFGIFITICTDGNLA